MGSRVRGLAILVVVLALGVLLGSGLAPWVTRGAGTSVRAGAEDTARADDAPAGERVRVEVLNGGGRGGMAAAATDHLRDRGFDVVYYGNADRWDQVATRVVDRVGRPDLARRVAAALGVTQVRTEPDSTRYVDVSVVLGSSWLPEAPVADTALAAPPAGERWAWWDLRRFLGGEGVPGGRLADPGDDGDGGER